MSHDPSSQTSPLGLRVALGALVALASAGLLAGASCGGSTATDKSAHCANVSDGAWVQSPTDPKCCAPPQNTFDCTSTTNVDAASYCGDDQQPLLGDASSKGLYYPLGCTVSLTACNPFYEGAPQTCTCGLSPIGKDGGKAPGWSCGI